MWKSSKMANNQHVGAGHGPKILAIVNMNAGCPPSPWTMLPKAVHKLLASKTGTEGLHKMRLVCTSWQRNVEECVGMKVKVDDSIKGNLEFIKRVKVANARIFNWTEDIGAEPANHLFQHPDSLKKLKLCGPMPAQWKIHDLCQFPNLQHLVLRDRALYSNNLTGHPYPPLSLDLTSNLPLEDLVATAFQRQDLPLEPQPIELKSLQTLEILVFYYPDYLYGNIQLHKNLALISNVCFILNNVTSPLLSVAHLYVRISGLVRLLLNKLNWKVAPLHRFLDNHRLSLRHLLLPGMEGEIQSSDFVPQDDLANSFPINLQKLMLQMRGKDPMPSTFPYLEKCLQGQTQLQEVHLTFYSFPLEWISDALTALANSCGRTLRYLQLDGYRNVDGPGTLDLQMLSVCDRLEVLQMMSFKNVALTNLEKLPASLKILVISEIGRPNLIEIADPNVFQKFSALEWLHLHGIIFQHTLNSGATVKNIPENLMEKLLDPYRGDSNQMPGRQFCRTMIRGILGLRQLQGFSLDFKTVWLNRDPSLVKLLRPLDPNVNPARRDVVNTVAFNLGWYWLVRERLKPWSDIPFDRETWDMEKEDDEENEEMRGSQDGENEDFDDDEEDEDMDDDGELLEEDEEEVRDGVEENVEDEQFEDAAAEVDLDEGDVIFD